MFRQLFPFLPLALLGVYLVTPALAALSCTPSAVPTVVHGEGITERTSDISIACSGGAAGATLNLDLFIFLNVNITNRLASASSNTLTGISFTADNGSGPQPISSPATLSGPGTLVFNGATFTLSSSGAVTLQLKGLRGAANLLDFDPSKSMQVSLGGERQRPIFGYQHPTAGRTAPAWALRRTIPASWFALRPDRPLAPERRELRQLSGWPRSSFTSTRVTEGYADSFAPKSDPQNLNADTGTRFVVQYSGFPAGAQHFCSHRGGGLGCDPADGWRRPRLDSFRRQIHARLQLVAAAVVCPQYRRQWRGWNSSLFAWPPGSGTVTLDSMSEVTLTNGSGMAVYEVVDANPSIQESAQFPTFLAIAPNGNGTSTTTCENVSLGPISTVTDRHRYGSNPTLPADHAARRLLHRWRLRRALFPGVVGARVDAELYDAGRRGYHHQLRASPEFRWRTIAMDGFGKLSTAAAG